jgi:predicted DCC family thiol-disulfide oxidoreductase YuxK
MVHAPSLKTNHRWSWRSDPQVPEFADDLPLIVFDGECALCSGTAEFVLRNDRRRRLRLTTAQGPLGTALYRHFHLRADEQGTVLLLKEGRLYTQGDAALGIAEELGWPWRAASMLRVAPRSIRNSAYRFIARNRFRLFARRQQCWFPSHEQADRIL